MIRDTGSPRADAEADFLRARRLQVIAAVTARLLRKEYPEHIHRHLWGEHFWSPSYFAASCGGAPLTVIKEYIENQKRPD